MNIHSAPAAKRAGESDPGSDEITTIGNVVKMAMAATCVTRFEGPAGIQGLGPAELVESAVPVFAVVLKLEQKASTRWCIPMAMKTNPIDA